MKTAARVIVLLLVCSTSALDLAVAQAPNKSKMKEPVWTPTRDAEPIVSAINREWAAELKRADIKPSARCLDSKFLRRAALDLTGRIPTLPQTITFLDDDSPDKRRELVDSLLGSRNYSEHLARCWKRLIQPPDLTSTKSSVDRFTPWLADQLAAGRGWNDVVRELLTAEVDLTREPRGAFFAANNEMAVPKPSLLAASVGRVFLGVQIGCAECHNHPFTVWTQEDFWGLAAFFGRTRKVSKGDFTLTEASEDGKQWEVTSITIPEGSGKASGRVVAARLLGGGEPKSVTDALRPQLAEWLTADSNPYFARAMVNRLWAHCMGRGLVEPLDDQREGNEPTHPELLDLLAKEFIASGYDVRHLLGCIVLSEPYQVSAQPTRENSDDRTRHSHHVARAITPDVLYDSLSIALNPTIVSRAVPGTKPPGKPMKSTSTVQLEPRDSFIRFFGRASLDDTGDVFSYGIPQLLRLMNDRELTQQPPFLVDLLKLEPDVPRRIETLFLIAYSRRPSEAESHRLRQLIANDIESPEGYASILWVLLNSTEFVVHD